MGTSESTSLSRHMELAIAEAELSLREGNNGFGAVIIRDDKVISAAHDTECTECDPTSHAEINAIKQATRKLGRDLNGCTLLSTHEPCPMCATAIVWSGISTVAYGYSIKEALNEGRKRIDMPCQELFERAKAKVKIYPGVMHDECSVLYREDVRSEIRKLRSASDEALNKFSEDSTARRIKWFEKNQEKLGFANGDVVFSAYKLLLSRLNITENDAPVIAKSEKSIVFHSKNFCPTLEACKIRGLDTRVICKKLNEKSTDALIKQIDPRLKFSRNYLKIRPYEQYCEEIISVTDE